MIVGPHALPAPQSPGQNDQSVSGTDMFGEAPPAVSFGDLLVTPAASGVTPAPPARSFEALGMFGQTHAVAFAADDDEANLSLADIRSASDPTSDENLPSPLALTPAISGEPTSYPDTMVSLVSFPSVEPASPHDVLVSPEPAGEARVAPMVEGAPQEAPATPEEEAVSDGRAAALPQSEGQQEAVQLAVVIQNGGIEIVARAGDADPRLRDTIRRQAAQIAAEYGLSLAELSLDGKPVPPLSPVSGDAFHGRRAR